MLFVYGLSLLLQCVHNKCVCMIYTGKDIRTQVDEAHTDMLRLKSTNQKGMS